MDSTATPGTQNHPTRRQAALFGLGAGLTAATASVAVVPSASAAQNPDSVWVGTHNTFSGASSFPRFADVIGWQEVNDAADRDVMRQRLGSGYRHAVFSGAASALPISWVSRFTKITQGVVRADTADVPAASARYITWVLLENATTRMRFAFVNTHFVSGAWNLHPERQVRWNRHLEVLKATVSRLQSEHGVPVVVVGDFNRAREEDLPGERMLDVTAVSGYTIDQIYVPRAAVSTPSYRLERYGSDHYAYRARIDW